MSRLHALSGFGTKGPACFLLEIAGRRVLLDLGMGPDAGRRPDLSGTAPVDAVLVSHAHADHCGALDLVGDVPVFCSALARECAPRALARARPLAEAGDALGLSIETGAAGHSAGAVWMRIGGPCGVLYTGDMSDPGGLFALSPPPPARTLVFDASYGAADEPAAAQHRRLLDLAAAGPLLLPAPPDGRGLEMALLCAEAGHRVALCTAHRRVAEALLTRPESLAPGVPERLERLVAHAAELQPDTPLSGVMVAAGANCGSGPAARLGPRALEDERATLLFTGHLSRGAPSADWVAAGRALWVRWNVHPTLTGLRALIATVRPDRALPAFVGAEGRAQLAQALPHVALTQQPELRC